MFFYIAWTLLATISVVVYKKSHYHNGVENAIGTAAVGFIVILLVGLAVVAPASIQYKTEYSTPLIQSKSGAYHKQIGTGNSPDIQYMTKSGLKSVSNDEDYEDDAGFDEIRLYYTRDTPRVERRCSYPADWVTPFGWSWRGYNDCDTNIYVPIKKAKETW